MRPGVGRDTGRGMVRPGGCVSQMLPRAGLSVGSPARYYDAVCAATWEGGMGAGGETLGRE